MTKPVKETRHDGRLTLTIDRPERRNALNAEVIATLLDALRRVQGDPTVRAVVLTGAGDEAFCAGADLGPDAFVFDYAAPTNDYADLLRTGAHDDRSAGRAGQRRLHGRRHGPARDVRSRDRGPERDLRPAGGKGRRVPDAGALGAAGPGAAALPHADVPDGRPHRCSAGHARSAWSTRWRKTSTARSSSCSARLQGNSPTALRRGLYAMKAMRSMSFEQAIAFAEGQIGLLAMTQDAREGITAFKEKRRPQWTGK